MTGNGPGSFGWAAVVLVLAACGALPAAADGPPAKVKLVFCCAADNDLYRVVKDNGIEARRFDSPAAAVDAAEDATGVLVLADGYPQKTTAVEAAVLKAAAAKKLRVYVEYPGALEGIRLAAPRSARLERAVVASDFFGPTLPPLRILAINALHFVPAAVEKPHVVAAKVAGFDRAVFGLPPQTFPILFEHPGGDLLVSTTKLSHFVTARYAPQDAWRAVWAGVLRWLCPGGSVRGLRWTPAVRPSFGPDEPLRADAELQALRRGAEWFLRSKLLMHPSRREEVGRALAGNGLAPTPPPDAPVGDGSMGILEAPLSVIQLDGRQLQGVSIRGDCNAESAMALALAAKALGEKGYSDIASNLLDFYLFRGDARKKERGDPRHGAYGLIAWGISTPAWYCANYGDDNARVMMGTLATAAVTSQDRWNEPMMLCLLANLRTAGQLGFRDDRIDIGPLTQHGWEHFFRRRVVSYSPHMEAYLWACYLWAYHKTGDDLFLQRARTAIGMTMKAFPDGWRWTNGLAQEKARMLLPLAWLVRVADTPEHRAWLRTMFQALAAIQQPGGAIQEEIGRLGRGMMPPPQSNEAYGANEASLIQQNGDPVSDLLYTVNFAFLGLHEAAAATGEKDYAQAADKLAAFLCRVQVRAEAHPGLDGGWFRAFDFRRWEHWASNADAGWGAWAIESGWTQGWITAVLALRHLKTSLWDLTAALKMKDLHDKLRPVMIPAEAIESLKGQTLRHAAAGRAVTLGTRLDDRYTGGGPEGLTDGRIGPPDHADPAWQGYWGPDLDATVDLGKVTTLGEISTRYLQSTAVGIFPPTLVEYAVSDDGKEFRVVAALKNPVPDKEPGPLIREFKAPVPNTRARYVRVTRLPFLQPRGRACGLPGDT